MNITKI